MIMNNDDMVEMIIQTETKPGVPNANGFTYSKKVYDDIVKQMEEKSRHISYFSLDKVPK